METMRAAIFVAAVIAFGPICQAGNVEQEASEKARKMVARFEAGDLSEGFDIFGVRDGDGPKIGSGPGITIDPTGIRALGTILPEDGCWLLHALSSR